jgi:hypothetical protein
MMVEHAPLFVRSFVEQQLDPESSNVTDLEKIRIFPPGTPPEDGIAVFMPPQDIYSIMEHRKELRGRFPDLETDNVGELPKLVQFKWAMPALLRAWIKALQAGRSEDDLDRAGWFDYYKWLFKL